METGKIAAEGLGKLSSKCVCIEEMHLARLLFSSLFALGGLVQPTLGAGVLILQL